MRRKVAWPDRHGFAIPEDRSSEPVGQLRDLIFWIEPGCRFGSPDVGLGPIRDRRIEASKSQHDGRLPHAFSKNMRAALRAKPAELPRGGLISDEKLLTLRPSKFFSRHGRERRECGRMRFPAGSTMTMDDGSGGGIDLVGNASAHAASRKHGDLLVCNDLLVRPMRLSRRFSVHPVWAAKVQTEILPRTSGRRPSFSESASRNREHPRLAIVPEKESDYRHHDVASNEPDRGRPVIARNTGDPSRTA
jgi:hypothetical protein